MFRKHGVEIYAVIAVIMIIPAYAEIFKRQPNLFMMLGLLCFTLLFAGFAMQAQMVRAAVRQR